MMASAAISSMHIVMPAADPIHCIFGEESSAADDASSEAVRIALIVSPSFNSISGFCSAGRP
jgi:hypothetical protein